MSFKIARKVFGPLLSGGLVLGICLSSTVTLSAQYVPVAGYAPIGPPAAVPATLPPTNVPPGSLPQAPLPFANLSLGKGYQGIDFLGSSCGCLPPDTNAAVSNDFVVEVVNIRIRVFAKATGAIVRDEPLSTVFGAPTGGDPYVLYDDVARRWYISAFDGNNSGLFLAVSSDANPLHGFKTLHIENLGFPDYEKPGFNKDAIFISYNDFGPGGGAAATILSIDKAAALSGSLIRFKSVPEFQFRAMPPAQMHGDTAGGVEWFVSTDGTDASGNTIRVTRMTNYLSNAPVFTYTSLPVDTYKSATRADQPGGLIPPFPTRQPPKSTTTTAIW